MSTVIKAENLSKEYRLGAINSGVLFKDLQSGWARLRGKDDPNQKVHEVKKVENETFLALNDISFEVKQGEILGIIGKNGAGKSTLLKILSRVTTPTKGIVRTRGRIASLLEVGTGFHPELSGRENIFLNGAILGMTRTEVKRKFDEIVDFSGVEQFIDTPVKRYSSGMYVRLAFAVAANLEPDILVVDEVLAVGDAEFQKKCLGKMQDVSQKQGRTVLFVSHSLEAIRRICSRGMLLRTGKIVDHGSIDATINAYKKAMSGNLTIGETGISDRLNRTNGFVQIQNLKAFTNKGKESWTFNHGDDIYFELEYRVKRRTKGLCFYMALLNPDSGQILTNVKKLITPKILKPDSVGKIEVTLNKIGLRPKYYKFYLALADKDFVHTYDVIDDNVALPELEIVTNSSDPHFSAGFFDLDAKIRGV